MAEPIESGRSGAAETLRPEAASLPCPDVRLDTVGLYCPVPIIKTQARIRSMLPGQVLEVASDDRVILLDMPAWCRSTGHEYLGAREAAGEILLYVRKSLRAAAQKGKV
jgi:tRNA 2-thiouridine synthesizing protein A